jgi:hypothetical protein
MRGVCGAARGSLAIAVESMMRLLRNPTVSMKCIVVTETHLKTAHLSLDSAVQLPFDSRLLTLLYQV